MFTHTYLQLNLFQEHTAQQEQIQSLTNDMDKLRRDNVKLFEKIRFLQSYPNKVCVGSLMITVTATKSYDTLNDVEYIEY